MTNNRMKPLAIGVGIAATAALPAYYLLVRRWHARWGATDEEVERAMPGDDLVEDPGDVSTRAVTMRATPADIWPWLLQMGYQRGGLYSNDWIDKVIGVLDEPSSWEILPEFQHLEAGDVIPIGGSGPDWPVKSIEPCKSLVLDIRPEGIDISWSIGLYEIDEKHTRFVLRIRIRMKPLMHVLSLFPISDFGQFLMVRWMLLGIKARAEALAAQRKT
jgi:hypothetical protein